MDVTSLTAALKQLNEAIAGNRIEVIFGIPRILSRLRS